jgi:site-specific recombinase XerD
MGKTKAKDLMMLSVEKATQIYLATLATEGKSQSYIDWLASRLKKFNNFLAETGRENCRLQELTVDDGREYIAFLMGKDNRYSDHPYHKETKGKLTTSYIHGLGRALRSFSSWAHEEGYLEENVMQRLKLPRLPVTYPVPLTEAEIEKVLSACLEESAERLRNFSIMMLFLDTGIRLSELTGLKFSRIDFPVGEMTVFGKGSKERKVPVGLQAKKALLQYLSQERPDPGNPQDDDFVFLSTDGYPITKDAVEKVFQRVKGKAGVNKLHPHICRHTFAVRYLTNGGDAFSLQKILGHTSLDMTRKYVNLASGDVKEKHRKFSPMDNISFRAKKRGRPKSNGNM